MDPSPMQRHTRKNILVYRGKSMSPTFAELDLLHYIPAQEGKICLGDIIAFHQPHENTVTIHRVRAKAGTVLITQGDNNPLPDPAPIENGQVIGIIRYRQRNRVITEVRGGRRGLARFWLFRIQRKIQGTVITLLGPPYRTLANHTVISRFSTGLIPRKVEAEQRNTGCEYRLICFGLRVGVFRQKNKCWDLQIPYHILIDRNKLPLPGPEEKPGPFEIPVSNKDIRTDP